MSTDPVQVERRSGQRFQLHLPLAIHVDGKAVRGFTQDVSSRGLFLYTEAQLAEGAAVELTDTLSNVAVVRAVVLRLVTAKPM